MRKPKVYVVSNKNYDLSNAALHGELVLIYKGTPPDIFMTSKHAHNIKEALKDMNPSDFLVCAGNMILVTIAFGVIMEKFGYVNLLLFDVRNLTYVVRTVPRHQLQGEPHGR